MCYGRSANKVDWNRLNNKYKERALDRTIAVKGKNSGYGQNKNLRILEG